MQAYTYLGQRIYIEITHELSVNTLQDMEGNVCNPGMNEVYDEVFYRAVSEKNEKELGCSTPWEPARTSKITGRELEICNDTEQGKAAVATLRNWIPGSDDSLESEYKPCSVFDIAFGLPQVDDTENNQNEAYIRIYLKQKIKVKSVVLYYDFTTLFAELGGYIGLFLGMSLIDFTLLFNVGLLALTKMILKQKRG